MKASGIEVSDIIAFAALLTSAITAIVVMLFNAKINIKSLNKSFDKVYFDEIFKVFLIKDMARILELIDYRNFRKGKEFPHEKELKSKLQMIYQKSTPYRFLNESFYKRIKNCIKKLEDKIFDLIQLHRTDCLTEVRYMQLRNDIYQICKEMYTYAKREYRMKM